VVHHSDYDWLILNQPETGLRRLQLSQQH